MAGHKERFRRLQLAIQGEMVEPVKSKSKGPINYWLMDLATSAISRRKSSDFDAFEAALEHQIEIGHLSRKMPDYVSECGSPGMHWSYNTSSVVGLALCLVKIKGPKSLRAAGVRWIANEAGFNREYRFNGEVWVCAPRVKDSADTKTGKDQVGHDGYRDVFTSICSGEIVQKPGRYWSDPQALAVKTMKELWGLLTADERYSIRTAGMPHTLLEIKKIEIESGGFLAYFEDNPFNHKVLGQDGCNWVMVTPQGGVCGLDWEPLPNIN